MWKFVNRARECVGRARASVWGARERVGGERASVKVKVQVKGSGLCFGFKVQV